MPNRICKSHTNVLTLKHVLFTRCYLSKCIADMSSQYFQIFLKKFILMLRIYISKLKRNILTIY